jgi:multidrug resistance efflux pump
VASSDLARRALAELPGTAEDTTGPFATLALGQLRFFADDWRSASETAARIAESDSVRFNGLALIGVLAARRGDRATAEWAESRAAAESDPYVRAESLLARAQVRAALGDPAGAVQLLREAIATGQLKAMNVHALVGLTSMRDYPGFKALIDPAG